jgi:ferrochelatase
MPPAPPAAPTTGLLLINLGTPESPAPRDVRTYLREFLSDPRVIDIPAWKRRLVLNLFILPFRPRKSGEAYSKIWTAEGSPLLLHGLALRDKIRKRLGPRVPVELGMRYGRPSIRTALEALMRAGVVRVVVFPLYPQYSSAATGSSLECVFAEAGRLWNTPHLQVVPPFFDHPAFIEAFARVARPIVDPARHEMVFFSFHGLPERQVRKSDPTGAHCLASEDCCEREGPVRRFCYRAQCRVTARLLGDALDVPEAKRAVVFQSRLGRDPWIGPATDVVLAERARQGMRDAAILSPAFVADCLETLEELGLRGRETWIENGGRSLDLVPCVNADDGWADAALRIAADACPDLGRRPETLAS